MVLKGYSTQAVLISMLKKWRQILDKKGCAEKIKTQNKYLQFFNALDSRHSVRVNIGTLLFLLKWLVF